MKKLVTFAAIIIAVFAIEAVVPQIASAQIPANDSCAGATLVTSLPFTVTQNTRLATPDLTDPPLACADGGGGKTVWFKYTADSTKYIDFTTEGSSPLSYDVAMGIFTGSCGSLLLDTCHDDIVAGVDRAARVRMLVHAGITYTILIAEWKGGGDTGGVPTGGDLIFRVCGDSCPPPVVPLAHGPKNGSVAGGAVVSTNNFPEFAAVPGRGGELEANEAAENEQPPLIPAPDDVMKPKGPEGSNYIEDKGIAKPLAGASQPVILRNFRGIPYPGQGIPPDPISAVGPNHILSCVNSTFRIFNKNGDVLKTIDASSWFSGVNPSSSVFDPQVVYDHFANRWVMVWDNTSPVPQLMISVSDDDNPLGTWYNWAIPAYTLGDSATTLFSDYPGLGFDDQALYIASNEFTSSFKYSKVRIIGKAQLYVNTAGPLTWSDFWDFRNPDQPGLTMFGIRPVITFGTPGVAFFLNPSPYTPGTFFTLWKLVNPLTAPNFTAVNIPVTQYLSASNADQLGGSSGYFIETGGSSFHFQPVYRDSSIWIAHSVASGTNDAFSAIHYVRINPFTEANLEDIAMGLNGYWHYYNSLMVDQDKNVVITFSRSSATEYAGAFISGRRDADPPGLSSSVPMKYGEGNYVVVGGSRNRWGDYNGIALDPSDGNAIWAFGEYATSSGGVNYSTWVSEVKMAPVSGRYIYAQPALLNYGTREKGTIGDTLNTTIVNYGLDSLTISSIMLQFSDTNFILVNVPSLPIKLRTYGTISFGAVFTPKAVGPLNGSIVIASDDAGRSPLNISLTGEGFVIMPVQSGTLYAAAGDLDSGKIITVNPFTGAGSTLGLSGYSKVSGARVQPGTNKLMGLIPSGLNTLLVLINGAAGDAHPVTTLPQQLIKGMTFRGDTLYVGRISGALYRVNQQTGALTQIAATGLSIQGLDFNPLSGELWASGRMISGGSVDRIYKISLPSGTPTAVGSTGLGTQVTDIVFDSNGNLFGVIGSNSPSSLIAIDTLTAAANVIGPIGSKGIQALAFGPGSQIPLYTYRLTPSWNMVSVPLTGTNLSKRHIFPSAASEAFSFQGGYAASDTLSYGKGYWLKFNSSMVSTMSGQLRSQDTINVRKSWNMVGSISIPVPVSAITPLPPGIITSYFLAYESGGYVVADSIKPGSGYWVRIASDGKLVLLSSPSVLEGASKGLDPQILNSFNSLNIRDAKGNTQMLYFGREPDEAFSAERFALPPAPPEGLNARFASNRMLETHPRKVAAAAEYPIVIDPSSPPVQIGWHVADDPGLRYSIISVNKTSSKVSPRVLKGDGTLTLSSQELFNLRLRVEQSLIPAEFALRQNYPNPFNPVTTIKYELPSDEFVTLTVYDILGREVLNLVNEKQAAGYYAVPFSSGNLSSGVYFYRLTAGKFANVMKMIMLK